VAYHFKSVTDVNRFLFNKGSNSNTRTLGQLRMSVFHKKIVPDDEGFFRLYTEEREISHRFGEKHKFTIKPRVDFGEEEGSLLGGNLLLFSNKFDLFKFLVSEDASDIEHLQFDESKIEADDDLVEQSEEKLRGFATKQDQEFCEEISHENGEGHDLKKVSKVQQVTRETCQDAQAVEILQNAIEKTAVSAENIQTHFDDSLQRGQVDSYGADVELLVGINSEKCVDTLRGGKEKNNDFQNNKGEKGELLESLKNKCKEAARPGPVKQGELKLALAKKEDEIHRLKGKLMAKEKLLVMEIQNKTAVDSKLKEAVSQLERIHQLSLSISGSLEQKNLN